MGIKKLIVGMLTIGMLGTSVLATEVKAETATGTLVLTNWYKPNSIEYLTKKYYNPYADIDWVATTDPKEIGALDHVLKQKNEDGTYKEIKLEETLPVGTYKIAPSHVSGCKTLPETEFTIKADDETVIDLVYTYNVVECAFNLASKEEDKAKLNSVSYEVHYVNNDGSIGEKILRGNTNTQRIEFNIDPGTYIMKVGNEGYFNFTANGDDPIVNQEIHLSALSNPDGSQIPGNGVINNGSNNATGGGANTVYNSQNPQTPPTSKMSKNNIILYSGIALLICSVGYLAYDKHRRRVR